MGASSAAERWKQPGSALSDPWWLQSGRVDNGQWDGRGWMGVGGMVMGHRVQHPVTSERAQQQLGKYWSHIYNNGLSQLDLVYRQTPAQNDPKEQNGSSPN